MKCESIVFWKKYIELFVVVLLVLSIITCSAICVKAENGKN